MIDYYEFQVLANSAARKSTQRDIAAKAGISVGSVNKAVASLQKKGLLNSSAAPTSAGIAALEPYRVDNAIILAAGMATRFAPLSFEKPKALFEVQGEILIERLIRQLKEEGVAVLMVSSDIEEVVELADRAITIFQGRINGEFSREEITQDALTSASFGIAHERKV